jgi:exosortase
MAKSQGTSAMIAVLKKYHDEFTIALLLLLVYIPTFIWMWDRWFSADSYYSHGILIPFVTAYLIWNQREELREFTPSSSPWGVKLFLLGVALHLFSAVFRIYFTSGFSLIVMLIGLILHFYGKEITRRILFPILFLVFMIPLPMVLVANISFKLKIFAAQLAAHILNNHLRIPCLQDGSTIRMQHTQVIVDDVCSGLRSLISLTALGAIFAYWLRGKLWKKAIVFISTVPIAVITNAMRIVLLSSVSEIWGAQYATGVFHDLSGLVVFALAFVLLFAVVKLLE